MRRSWWIPVLAVLACGQKKAPESTGPIVGWHQEEGWLGACYFPPNFDETGGGARRMMRNDALTEIMTQWRGQRDDGVTFDPKAIDNVETALLTFPEKIEELASENAAQCKQAMTGKGTSSWEQWLVASPGRLLAGECRRPLTDTLFNYLDIGTGWQFTVGVCDENLVRITATANDEFRVDDDGPWINADGDADKLATSDYPCNIEGCLVGQLILQFRGDSGIELVKPIGLDSTFDPPEHGTISVMVNDTTYYNNEFRIQNGIQHHTGITYTPVE